jgi:lipopolysaccharide transport system permease protein
MAIFVSAIGVVYAILFRQPISEYLPYIATTYVVWTLISGVGLESTVIFQQSGFGL